MYAWTGSYSWSPPRLPVQVGDKDVQRHSSRTFAETLMLPGSAQASKLKQSFENGVLIVSIGGNGNTT